MDTKTIWTSQTIWGAVIMLLPVILQLFGINLSAGDASTGVGYAQSFINDGIALFGFAMTVIGRMKAKGPATVLPPGK
jgi:hypothetical protein